MDTCSQDYSLMDGEKMDIQEEQKLREMIDNMKMDNSVQTETIKEKLKKLVVLAYNKGYNTGRKEK